MDADELDFHNLIFRQKDLIWHICQTYRLSEAWQTEDLFQEVLCVLWRDYKTFNRHSSERTWVYRVATNTLLSLKRKQSNLPSPTADKILEPTFTYDDNTNHLLQLIDSLGEPDSRIIKAHLAGFNHTEIAHITQLSTAAVAMRLMRAKRKLRNLYEYEK